MAVLVANLPVPRLYFDALHIKLGGLSLQHWINDGLMAVFFLLVGLEIKREIIDGELSSWPRRILPGLAALGGMLVPAPGKLDPVGSKAPCRSAAGAG